MTDDYYVCQSCAHYWASPEYPLTCENCHDEYVTRHLTIEEAENESQDVIDR